MKVNSLIFILAVFSLAACVTEPKGGDTSTKNFATASSSGDVVTKTALTTTKDSLPGHIVVKCRIQGPQVGKLLLCHQTMVKLTDEAGGSVMEYTFKGDRGAIPVTGGSFLLETTTKGCPDNRRFQGMTSGMGLTAQFENCTTVK